MQQTPIKLLKSKNKAFETIWILYVSALHLGKRLEFHVLPSMKTAFEAVKFIDKSANLASSSRATLSYLHSTYN